jgi:hypothetical protein
MRIKASVTVTVLVGLVVVAGSGIVLADDPIASLNRTIQDRFKDIDKLFGLRRIVVIGDTPHRFRPETVGEFAAVQELKDGGLRVALYVAGRRVLEQEPDLTTKEPFGLNRRVIFGPIAVTDRDVGPGLPAPTDLIDESRIAFRMLGTRDRHDFVLAEWRFTARAVRATTSQCLSCHRGRSLGEPLGVILYAYQPRD